MDEMIAAIIDDLTTELQDTPDFNVNLLTLKVNGAVRDVIRARAYPDGVKDLGIEDDIINYRSQIENIARYDYTQIGVEYEASHSENGISRTWGTRERLFAGIIPVSRVI